MTSPSLLAASGCTSPYSPREAVLFLHFITRRASCLHLQGDRFLLALYIFSFFYRVPPSLLFLSHTHLFFCSVLGKEPLAELNQQDIQIYTLACMPQRTIATKIPLNKKQPANISYWPCLLLTRCHLPIRGVLCSGEWRAFFTKYFPKR